MLEHCRRCTQRSPGREWQPPNSSQVRPGSPEILDEGYVFTTSAFSHSLTNLEDVSPLSISFSMNIMCSLEFLTPRREMFESDPWEGRVWYNTIDSTLPKLVHLHVTSCVKPVSCNEIPSDAYNHVIFLMQMNTW